MFAMNMFVESYRLSLIIDVMPIQFNVLHDVNVLLDE